MYSVCLVLRALSITNLRYKRYIYVRSKADPMAIGQLDQRLAHAARHRNEK